MIETLVVVIIILVVVLLLIEMTRKPATPPSNPPMGKQAGSGPLLEVRPGSGLDSAGTFACRLAGARAGLARSAFWNGVKMAINRP